MAFTGVTITIVGLVQLDFPTGTVRLTDGGFADFGGNRFVARHPVFGALAQADPVEAVLGGLAPGATLSLLPDPSTPLSNLLGAGLADSRVQMWLGQVDADMVTVADAEQLFDGFVDTVSWRPIAGALDLSFVNRAEKLFLRNEGNVLSSAFHKNVWPGEKGCDNCTDAPVSVAWGTRAPPRSTTVSLGTSGGGRNARVRALLNQ